VPRGFPTPIHLRAHSGVRRRTVPTALIVEDDDTIATSIAGLLEDEGYAVAVSRTLSEARAALAYAEPNVLLLDLTLPDAFGGELLHDLGRAENAPPTVLMTTFPLAHMLAEQHDIELVAKPFLFDELLTTIRRAREQSRRPRRVA
jgi:DNA-binding NtrC family response regulator